MLNLNKSLTNSTRILSLLIFISIFLLFFSSASYALNIASVEIPDQITLDGYDGPLILNGAGTRHKYIFDIYIGALYLTSRQNIEHAILCSDTPKRIALYFLYDEVSREKLQEGWLDGFMHNNSDALISTLADRLGLSLTHFRTMKHGDFIYFDYLPHQGTRISVNNELLGVIEGFDFMQAVFKVWIGQSPAQLGLKFSMLGLDEPQY